MCAFCVFHTVQTELYLISVYQTVYSRVTENSKEKKRFPVLPDGVVKLKWVQMENNIYLILKQMSFVVFKCDTNRNCLFQPDDTSSSPQTDR